MENIGVLIDNKLEQFKTKSLGNLDQTVLLLLTSDTGGQPEGCLTVDNLYEVLEKVEGIDGGGFELCRLISTSGHCLKEPLSLGLAGSF